MADISAKDVAALRKMTGAGMMDCKQALEESDGDMERAKDWLREKGKAGSAKRVGRSADQGAVEVLVDGSVGALVELNCETDFVAKSADFTALLGAVTRAVVANPDGDPASLPVDGGTVADAIGELGAKIGEKLELGRVSRYETTDGLLDVYKHVQSERGVVGVLVELGGVDPANAQAREVAHDIALHIASQAPRYVTRDDVPAEEIDRERAVLETQTREEGKPEQAIAKIVDGKLGGFFKQVSLLDQAFVKDQKTTIGALVASLGGDAVVRRFVRVKIGED
ncbi:MAG TPA: translation elongation factor Ts [Acidimicrobiia bacterium]|nr:translation elongation factor Ts [Acidimicrobiia bacterium]